MMLFEDDGYLGALSAELALKFEVCLGQPGDGAARRALADAGDRKT